jgi:curved DNA-binding protein CbpA
MSEDLKDSYEVLGVDPRASAQDIKAAYRDLTKVWHPDRFAHDPRLQQKAQDKLKEINEAYEELTKGRKTTRRARPSPTPSRPDRPEPRGRTASPSLILPVVVFLIVFSIAASVLFPRGGSLWPRSETPVNQTEEIERSAQEGPRDEAKSAGEQSLDRRRIDRPRPAEDAAIENPVLEEIGQPKQPVQTVTITIDPSTGLRANPSCPGPTRMTYVAGLEPQQYCTAHRPEPKQPPASGLKKLARRIASADKWLKDKENTDAEKP